jgi:hypothetical protein
LAGLLFKFVVAWFVPNGKRLWTKFSKVVVWAGFGRGLFLEQNYGLCQVTTPTWLSALMLSTLSFQQLWMQTLLAVHFVSCMHLLPPEGVPHLKLQSLSNTNSGKRY